MTQKTLKHSYEQKKLIEVKNKLEIIDKKILENSIDYRAALLLEALDEKEFQEATEVIQKLQKINDLAKKNKLLKISNGISKILKEINSFTGTEPSALAKLGSKLRSYFMKTPAKNPILAGLTVIEALEAGFKSLPTILKNNIDTIDSPKKKDTALQDLEMGDDVKKNITTTLTKAFVPGGTFGKIFNKTIPGIKIEDLVADIFKASITQLNEINGALQSGPSPAEVDPAVANPKEAGASGAGAKEDAGKQAPLTGAEAKQQVIAVQSAAKDAGIKEEETVTRFLDNVMGWKEGIKHPYSDTAIQVLKSYAYNKAKIAKGQLDGFVDGISVDATKVKKEIQGLVDKAEAKKAEEAKKAGGKGEEKT